MKSKLPIIVLIIVLVVVYAYSGIDYMKQRQEQAVLTSRIADTRQTLAQMPVPPQNLEPRLAAAEARLSTAQSSFPTRLNSTQVINNILKLANRHNITAIPLSTQAWSTEKVRQHDYHVFRLHITLVGSYSQLVTFVSELEDGEYKTLIVEDLSVTRVNEQSEEGITGITASLKLAIYTQSPISD